MAQLVSVKSIIVLTVISLVSSTVLAMLYEVTKEPIAVAERNERLKALREVLPPFANEPDEDRETVVVGRNKRGKEITTDLYFARDEAGNLVGTALTVFSKNGYGGEVDVLVGVKPDGVISGIYILKHLETPGLGARIVGEGFTGQFEGRSLENTDFRVKKDGGDIDAITGATISPRAVTEAVKWGLEIVRENAEGSGGTAEKEVPADGAPDAALFTRVDSEYD